MDPEHNPHADAIVPAQPESLEGLERSAAVPFRAEALGQGRYLNCGTARAAKDHTSMTFLQRLRDTALGILFVLAAAVFASIALGIALAVGVAAWAWLAWRSRSLPRRHTIEGEYRDITNLEGLEDRGGKRL
jgi:hypothetical protein